MNKLLATFAMLFFCQIAIAQKFLIIDAYGYQRTKLYVGDQIIFRTHDTPARYSGIITDLLDSAMMVSGFDTPIPLSEVHTIYFQRKFITILRAGLGIFTIGYSGAALLHPIYPNAQYDAKESLIIAASSLVLSQFLRIFKWRKFKIKAQKRRIRVLDLNPLPVTEM